MKTYGDKVYTNFRGLNVPKDDKNANLLQSFLLILYLYMKIQIFSASIFRKLCLQNYKQTNGRLS